MNIWYIVVGVVGVLGIGFASTWHGMFRLVESRDFAVEYLQKFQKFASTYEDGFDGELFYWLTHRGPKIQAELGVFGVADYRPPAANYMFKNYQLIVNMLPEIRSGVVNSYQIAACEDALVRYIGWLDDRIEESLARLRNPVIWFRNGFRWILALPVMILQWFGLIAEASATRFTSGPLFNFFAGMMGLLSSSLAVLAYVLGADELTRLLRSLIGWH